MASENIRHNVCFGDTSNGNYTELQENGDIQQYGTASCSLGAVDSPSAAFEVVTFSPPTSTPSETETNKVYWNDQAHTLSIVTGLGHTVEVCQTQFGLGVNGCGETAVNGKCVYMKDAQGNRPLFDYADAATHDKSSMVGIVTHDIEDNQEGIITTFGLLHGYDTHGYADGAKLYLKADGSGDLTDSIPAAGSHVVWVATCMNSTVNGTIFIRPIHETEVRYENYGGMFGNVAGGNYTNFSDNGHMTALGTASVFLDELSPLIGARLESPASDILQDNTESAIYFKDSATTVDYVSLNFQFNHNRKEGAVVKPHIHWWQASATIPNWLIQYRWQRQGLAKETSWTSVKWASHVFTYTSGTINQVTTFGELTPPENDGPSTQLQVRVIRDTTNASTLFTGVDGLAGDVYAVSFDVHKECDQLGTNTERGD